MPPTTRLTPVLESLMVAVTLRLPLANPQGVRFSDEYHAQFLDYASECFLGTRFLEPRGAFCYLLVVVEGGMVSRGTDLRSFVNVAKVHYRADSIRGGIPRRV